MLTEASTIDGDETVSSSQLSPIRAIQFRFRVVRAVKLNRKIKRSSPAWGLGTETVLVAGHTGTSSESLVEQPRTTVLLDLTVELEPVAKCKVVYFDMVHMLPCKILIPNISHTLPVRLFQHHTSSAPDGGDSMWFLSYCPCSHLKYCSRLPTVGRFHPVFFFFDPTNTISLFRLPRSLH